MEASAGPHAAHAVISRVGRLRARTSSITWGDGVAPDSGYLFEPGADILGAAVGVPLLLGEFTHFNEVIPVPDFGGALAAVAARLKRRRPSAART